MNSQTYIAIANLLLMAAVGIAWVVGIRNAPFAAIGTATFGFAFLWPQYKFERGVWMGGLLLLPFSASVLLYGIVEFSSDELRSDLGSSGFDNTTAFAGIAVLIGFIAFTIYATIVNFRFSRTPA